MKNKHSYFNLLVICALISFLFVQCQTIPENVKAVENFDQSRYLGKWYEIARFDFKFEKNLKNTTATYSLNKDGSIKVVNTGFDTVERKQKEAVGKAKFVNEPTQGMLKVSFFGPFYSGYNVIALDSAYQYALIAGKNLDYLWILSRTPILPDQIKREYLVKAKEAGYDLNKLIWVQQDSVK
ncbi:Outer membrane lipoprotein blc precursor [Sphingobacterium spiritivorum]|uniref:Outer membrane lipoprotein Blc n=1 Tax=Sphingobacterium spiritivorum TaxID=258 RepID=A0A380C8R3_SPHSI|nr:lipocalin family protein [Sphingobacterium spiritivorum]SUJ14074.1 Outer membrane lipoprotein blc precursor [Sphingobacterium spiritivorum]